MKHTRKQPPKCFQEFIERVAIAHYPQSFYIEPTHYGSASERLEAIFYTSIIHWVEDGPWEFAYQVPRKHVSFHFVDRVSPTKRLEFKFVCRLRLTRLIGGLATVVAYRVRGSAFSGVAPITPFDAISVPSIVAIRQWRAIQGRQPKPSAAIAGKDNSLGIQFPGRRRAIAISACQLPLFAA
jgi:hypothetical protein